MVPSIKQITSYAVPKREISLDYLDQRQQDAGVNGYIQSSNVPMSTSHINGEGLWASWTRNFVSPELALLDLLDNAIDATLVNVEQFKGRIEVYSDPPIKNGNGRADGICLKNNCFNEIPDLSTVLTVYGSEKQGDQIGENGVGIKQACAALSDLSIIISMNEGNKFSIGFLFKDLQTPEGCLIPSFTFKSDNVVEEIKEIANKNSNFHAAMVHYGDGNFKIGLDRLLVHLKKLSDNNEEERAFLVVLHRVLHRGHGGGVKSLMKSLSSLLPKMYLHIPEHFDVIIDSQKLNFKYWEKRLVEIHKFTVKIDPNRSFLEAKDWENPNHAHKVVVYLGFDPFRCDIENDNKASLLIYSRKSGRLVRETKDARVQLGLTSGGSEFAQGLTVILDDVHGKLPLTPTKQDIAFGQEACGKIHEKNLMTWLGAFTHLYYYNFLDMYGKNGKSDLRMEVLNCKEELNKMKNPVSLEKGTYSTMHGLQFIKKPKLERIRCLFRNKQKPKLVVGKDTIIKLRKHSLVSMADNNSKIVSPTAKRKATKSVIQKPSKRPRIMNDVTIINESAAEASDDSMEEELSDRLKFREMQLRIEKEKHSDTNRKLEEKVEESDVLRKDLEVKVEENDVLRKKNDKIRKNKNKLREENDVLRNRIKDVEAENEKSKAENEDLLAQLQMQRSQLINASETIQRLRRELESSKLKCAEQQQNLKNQQSDIIKLREFEQICRKLLIRK